MRKQKSITIVETIIKAGLLTGCLDIAAALLQFYLRTGKSPVVVLNFIASGVFGKTAFTGEMGMTFWGLLFHFIIAFVWTMIFFLLYPKIALLSKNKIINGILFGFIIWSVMTRIILPISNTPKIPFDLIQAVIGILILMLAVGMPNSFLISKYYLRRW